ncbi:amino acid/polyamine transporter I [Dactylonectria estremocensis]|uniref:Amino acid/polyamine transporter I n=1 Tax=Dactylonectria estremocensis TaxID=1079267 RepID=A0A9P9DCB4_9HYPO|nr:amino acid/polyamine transporter I [Dactylonectria estremocensis]
MVDDLRTQSNGSTMHMPRIFSLTSTLAMAFSITNTWIGYSATFVTPLLAGGGPAVVFCLILACVACTIIALGLAELASAFPSSGGQYHFASMVSTERYRAPVAFTVGWISILGWLFTTASTTIFCSQTSLMLASLYHPSYIWTAWQVWLIYTLITAISCLFIILLPRWIPAAEKVFLFSSLLGLVVAFVTVLATSQEKQPAKVIFAEWVNVTGWPDGLAFILATGQAMYGFLGMDGATHIAEELPNPEKTVPKVIIMIMAIGTATSIPWTIAMIFSTNDLDRIAGSALPIFEVFLQAINSQAAATFFTVWICFIYYGALVSCFVTSGRLIWAFSRDGGLPYSHIFAKIHPTLLAPVNATLLAGVFMVVFGLLYIASTTAYNSIVGLAILATNLTCAIPQTIVLIRGRRVLPKRYLNLGAIGGTFCNVFSTLYATMYTVLFCFPLMLPVAAESMNYLSVVLVGALIFVTILWWAGKRHTFHGPSLQSEGVVIESRVVDNGVKNLHISKQSDKTET